MALEAMILGMNLARAVSALPGMGCGAPDPALGAGEGRRRAEGGAARILYLEDVEDIAEVTAMALEEIGGFEVRICASGREALEAAEDYRPDLLLLDVMLPGMDGMETFARLRAMPGLESVPALFLTARAQVHEQAAYMDLGARGVIPKPYDPDKLCETVRRHLRPEGPALS